MKKPQPSGVAAAESTPLRLLLRPRRSMGATNRQRTRANLCGVRGPARELDGAKVATETEDRTSTTTTTAKATGPGEALASRLKGTPKQVFMVFMFLYQSRFSW